MSQTYPKRYPKQRKKQQKNRRPLIYIISGLAFFVLAFLGLKAVGNAATPKAPVTVKGSSSLVVSQKAVDLGTIRLGSTASYKFTLTNVGDKPLKINKEPYVEVAKGC